MVLVIVIVAEVVDAGIIENPILDGGAVTAVVVVAVAVAVAVVVVVVVVVL